MNVVLGDLPTWNLSDLYSSPGGTDLGADLKRAAAEAEAFAKDYEGRIVSLDGKALGEDPAGVPVTLHRYKGATHGFVQHFGWLPEYAVVFDEIAEFLNR